MTVDALAPNLKESLMSFDQEFFLRRMIVYRFRSLLTFFLHFIL